MQTNEANHHPLSNKQQNNPEDNHIKNHQQKELS
jgi:hypothetical protein